MTIGNGKMSSSLSVTCGTGTGVSVGIGRGVLVRVGARVAVGRLVGVGVDVVLVAVNRGVRVAVGDEVVRMAVDVSVGSSTLEGVRTQRFQTTNTRVMTIAMNTKPNTAIKAERCPPVLRERIEVGVLTTLEIKVSLSTIAAMNSPAVLNRS